MTSMKYSFLLLLVPFVMNGQMAQFTEQDSLRGSITSERAWWDLTYYHLKVDVDPEEKYIEGSNTVQYRVLSTRGLLY